jgi:hydrogenase expression/formation protein HypE
MTHVSLHVGKLPSATLAALLARYGSKDSRVAVGPAIGEDATAIDMGDRYLIAKTDPITFATDEIGWYAVNVNANDVACRGAEPRWFLCTLLMPDEGADLDKVESIFAQIAAACSSLGASLVGGHTEVTHGLKRPIVVGQMLGEVAKHRMVTTRGAQPGDAILLTKAVAIEGTALIAREKQKELRARGFSDDFLAEARDLLYRPGISVVRDALTAVDTAPIHAMHDPTEGGVVMGLYEIAQAAQLGLRVDADKIPVLPATQRICQQFKLHPLGLLSSGALLLTVAPQDSQCVIDALAATEIPCAEIGHMLPSQEGCRMRQHGDWSDLPLHERDEITRIL